MGAADPTGKKRTNFFSPPPLFRVSALMGRTDPFICARAPDRCAPRGYANVVPSKDAKVLLSEIPERDGAIWTSRGRVVDAPRLNDYKPKSVPQAPPRSNAGGNTPRGVGATCFDGSETGLCTDVSVDACSDGRVVRNKCPGPSQVRCCIRPDV